MRLCHVEYLFTCFLASVKYIMISLVCLLSNF
jgi:hypothetical protein